MLASNLGAPTHFRQRPYYVEYTRSHPNSEVKQRKARSVLGWGTAWEVLRVLLAFCLWGCPPYSPGSGPGACGAIPLETCRIAKPGPRSDTNNTEREEWSNKSVFGFRAARCCKQKTNFEFSSVLRSRVGSPAKSFEGGR